MPPRYASIDLLRTLAIVLMVVVHFMENLSGVDWAPAGFGAPLFAFLAGLSFRLWAAGREAKGASDDAVRRTGVRRGLFLFALGFVFNVCVWLPGDTFNWDVLTMTGTGLVVLALARRVPVPVLVTAATVLVALSPFLRYQADYLSYWSNDYFECDLTLPDVLTGYLATGYFPLFPWLAFPLAGYVAGTVVFPDDAHPASPPSVRPLVAAGGGLVLLAVLCRVGHHTLPHPVPSVVLIGWHMFPASPEYVCGTLGFALLAFAGLHAWVDRRGGLAGVPAVLPVARTMSKYSLSMYLLHHVLHLWPLWVYGWLAGDEPTEFWREALPVGWSLGLVPVCLGVCYLLFRGAERWHWPTTESLMRWLCD